MNSTKVTTTSILPEASRSTREIASEVGADERLAAQEGIAILTQAIASELQEVVDQTTADGLEGRHHPVNPIFQVWSQADLAV